MKVIVPEVPKPPEFPAVELKHEDIVELSEVNGKTLMYAKCKVDKKTFSEADVAECDLVGLKNENGVMEEVVFGKAYIWEGGDKYVVVLPKQIYYYSGYEGGRPYDNPNPYFARFFIVEKR